MTKVPIFYFTGQLSMAPRENHFLLMALNPLQVANEASSAESNVVKLEELEKSPMIEDTGMKKSSTSDD